MNNAWWQKTMKRAQNSSRSYSYWHISRLLGKMTYARCLLALGSGQAKKATAWMFDVFMSHILPLCRQAKIYRSISLQHGNFFSMVCIFSYFWGEIPLINISESALKSDPDYLTLNIWPIVAHCVNTITIYITFLPFLMFSTSRALKVSDHILHKAQNQTYTQTSSQHIAQKSNSPTPKLQLIPDEGRPPVAC